jgi:uncharacterized membrane protein (DUF485 family)
MTDGEEAALISAITADTRYVMLVRRRSRLSWWLSAIIFLTFLGYLMLIAFDKALLAMPIAGGATSLGIPVGLGVILLAVALTATYVVYANRHFDAAMANILKDHGA